MGTTDHRRCPAPVVPREKGKSGDNTPQDFVSVCKLKHSLVECRSFEGLIIQKVKCVVVPKPLIQSPALVERRRRTSMTNPRFKSKCFMWLFRICAADVHAQKYVYSFLFLSKPLQDAERIGSFTKRKCRKINVLQRTVDVFSISAFGVNRRQESDEGM